MERQALNIEQPTPAATVNPSDFMQALRDLCQAYTLEEPSVNIEHGATRFTATIYFGKGWRVSASDDEVSRACEKAAEIAIDYLEKRWFSRPRRQSVDAERESA